MKGNRFRVQSRYPIVAVGLASVGFILIKTGRDAIFFQEDGLQQLPLAYIWIALASVPAAMLHLQVIDRWGARRARTGIFFLSAAIFLSLAPFVEAGEKALLTGLFVLVPTLFAALFAGAWLLAGDLLEGAEAADLRRAYTRIGASSMLGGVLGGLLAREFAAHWQPRLLVASGASVLVGVGLLIGYAHRRYQMPDATAVSGGRSKSTSMLSLFARHAGLFKNRYIALIASIGGLMALAGLAIEFQFYASAVVSGKNNLQFFANFYIIVNALSLVLQLFVAPALQKRFGIGGALLVLPGILLSGAGLFSWSASMQARTLLKVTEGSLKASIHRSSWEQVYLPIERESRVAVKSMVDGLLARLSEGLGAAVLYAWVRQNREVPLSQLDLNWISWAVIGVLALWLGFTLYLKKLGQGGLAPEVAVPLPDGCPVASAMGQGKHR